MYRVLIADDEMIERTVLYRTLEKHLKDQCEFFQAENGREALEIYEKEKIQILILDIEMPGINGIQAAEKIREKDKECSIIFLTAFDEFAYAKKAITVRALDYLLKPYDERELILVMEEAFRVTDSHQRDKASVQNEFYVEQKQTGSVSFVSEEIAKFDNNHMGGVTELILKYIQQNYKYDISMQDLAKAMNYSEAYFCKLFKQYFNKNFTAYLTEYRVKVAKKMLEQPTVNVKEVGKAVGYMDSNYFTRVFKRLTGQTPTEYRLYIFQKKKR
ncbi:MAG: response regulator [Hungatella sp.]|nr:response regulator [Hungatella sp.]